ERRQRDRPAIGRDQALGVVLEGAVRVHVADEEEEGPVALAPPQPLDGFRGDEGALVALVADRPIGYEGYQSAFITAKAVEWLRGRERDRPFFLFVGYVDTHSPFKDHPERLVAPYRRSITLPPL